MLVMVPAMFIKLEHTQTRRQISQAKFLIRVSVDKSRQRIQPRIFQGGKQNTMKISQILRGVEEKEIVKMAYVVCVALPSIIWHLFQIPDMGP